MIGSFKNKEDLEQINLGKNPILGDLKRAISKKKKFSGMTEEERKNDGITPNVWDLAINFQSKILVNIKEPIYTKIL